MVAIVDVKEEECRGARIGSGELGLRLGHWTGCAYRTSAIVDDIWPDVTDLFVGPRMTTCDRRGCQSHCGWLWHFLAANCPIHGRKNGSEEEDAGV